MQAHREARHENTYLQSRTINAITGLEILVARLATKEHRERIVPEKVFKRVTRTLKKILQAQSEELGIVHDQRAMMEEKLPELNRPPSREQIGLLIQAAGLSIDRDQIDKFLDIRNSLVHTGNYTKKLGLSTWQQHLLIVEFIDCLFLGLLGYQGNRYSPLNNWQSVPFP